QEAPVASADRARNTQAVRLMAPIGCGLRTREMPQTRGRMKVVRRAVARSELTSRTPALASTAVIPAKAADNSAQCSQLTAASFARCPERSLGSSPGGPSRPEWGPAGPRRADFPGNQRSDLSYVCRV